MRRNQMRFFAIVGGTAVLILVVMLVNRLWIQPKQTPEAIATQVSATQTVEAGSQTIEWFGIPNVTLGNMTGDGLRIEILRINNDAWPLVRLENEFNEAPPADKRMLMLTLRVTNVSAEGEVTIREALFRIIDEQLQPYTTYDPETRCGVIPEPLEGTVRRGESVTGNICVQVPVTAQQFVLEYRPLTGSQSSTFFRVLAPEL